MDMCSREEDTRETRGWGSHHFSGKFCWVKFWPVWWLQSQLTAADAEWECTHARHAHTDPDTLLIFSKNPANTMKAHLSPACQSAGLSSCPTRDSWFWTAAYVLTAASQPGLSSFFPFSPFIPLALWTAYHISIHAHWLNSGSSWLFFPSSVLLCFARVPFSSRTVWRYECMQK